MLPDIIDISISNNDRARTLEQRINALYEHLAGPQPQEAVSKSSEKEAPYGMFPSLYETEKSIRERLLACGYILDNIERLMTVSNYQETDGPQTSTIGNRL